MTSVKPTSAPLVTPISGAATQPAAKTESTQQVTGKKPVVKKSASAKPVGKKLSTTRTPDAGAAVNKPVAKTPRSKILASARLEKAVKTTEAAKPEKARKPKLVRDSFTIPKVEYVVLEALKQRATRLNRSVKKSELLRAGIKALAAMHDSAFLTTLELVPAIKIGRPASES